MEWALTAPPGMEKNIYFFFFEPFPKTFKLLLQNTNFEFNGQFYKQCIGAVMGSPPMPTNANIFMAKILDKVYLKSQNKYLRQKTYLLRYLRDFWMTYFFIFIENMKVLNIILDYINLIQPSIKFTMKNTFINELNPCDPQTFKKSQPIKNSIFFQAVHIHCIVQKMFLSPWQYIYIH